jgi:hypothetical protein
MLAATPTMATTCPAGYREGMSTPAAAPGSPVPPTASPRAIRAALLPEEAGDFDREYRLAMAEATESLDLTGVMAVLRRWQRVGWSSGDEGAHRRMLERVDRLAAGTPVSTEPWAQTKARLGL